VPGVLHVENEDDRDRRERLFAEPKAENIPTVVTLICFEDTEGNVVGAMQYEK